MMGGDIRTAPAARRAHRSRVHELAQRIFAPRPQLTLSQWSDRYRILSTEASAEGGPWSTDRVPYMREIMDTISDPAVREVVIMKSAQVGYTQALLNAIGYHIHQDPCPILVVLPSDGEAEKFSKEKLAPMLRDTPVVGARVAESKSRDAANTILGKQYDGGFLGITGATSPKGLRSRSSRVVLFDEIDAYPLSAGSEGDPIKLAEKRALSFWNRKIVKGSTPTIKGVSRIEQDWERSDQRRYFVPCPHCGTSQVLTWGGIQWDGDDPTTAYYVCLEGCVIDEALKPRMIPRGEWRPTNPEGRVPGFHLSALISLFEGAAWRYLVEEHEDAKGKPEQLKVWTNTVLGEPYQDLGETIEAHHLLGRLERFPVDADGGPLVPDGVRALTRAVDVQDDRLEVVVYGWGVGEECWRLDKEIIPGSPAAAETWAALDAVRARVYRRADGTVLPVRPTFLDSGGHHTDAVYRYTAARLGEHVYACKGASTANAPIVGIAKRVGRPRVPLWPVGSSTGKEALRARLVKVPAPGPGYVHLPDTMQLEEIEQLTAETQVTQMIGGLPRRVWIKLRERNEETDLWVYALAALRSRGPSALRALGILGRAAPPPDADGDQPPDTSGDAPPPAPTSDPPPLPPPSSPPAAPRRGFRNLNRWMGRRW